MKIIKYPSGYNQHILQLKPFKATLYTNGKGLWSNCDRKIVHSKIAICLWDEELDCFMKNKLKFAELQVYFPKKYWDTDRHGLIYTDGLWLKGLKKHFDSLGFSAAAVKAISYSEQGMQGDNYVSLDVGKAFLKEARDKFNIV